MVIVMNSSELVSKAESAIGAILAQLERDTGATVSELSITAIEATNLQDERRRFMQKVVIELFRTPGNQWSS